MFVNFQALNAMLMSWYMVGYHSGYYLGLQHGLVASKPAPSDQTAAVPRPASHAQTPQQPATPCSDNHSALNFPKPVNSQVTSKSPQQDNGNVPTVALCDGSQQASDVQFHLLLTYQIEFL